MHTADKDTPALAVGSSSIQALSIIGKTKQKQMFALNTYTYIPPCFQSLSSLLVQELLNPTADSQA